MTKIFTSALSALLLALCAASSNAAVIELGSITKTYGSGSGMAKASTGTGSCDTLNTNSITVYDTSSGCGRFNDLFDFNSLNYTSLDHLTLTLSFSGTNNRYLGIFPEDWKVQIADTTSHRSTNLRDMTSSTNLVTQSFTINAANHGDVFGNISANEKLYLWFGDEALGANNFNLSSAQLQVYGTAVPEPSSIALFGIALCAFGLLRRRQA